MKKMHLSKTKYCRAKQCNKMLWLDQNKPEEAEETNIEAILENGTEVGELARKLFGTYTNIEYKPNLKEMIRETLMFMQYKPNVITEASFEYDNNFCSVDILKNKEDGVDIYEVKSSTHIEDIYLDDVSYQVYILTNLGYRVKSANIIYLNSQYIRQGKLDLNQLFNKEDVTEIAFSKQQEIKDKIEEINIYLNQPEEQEQEIGMHCLEPYKCIYWPYCTKHLPEKNVFSVREMHKKKMFDLYKKGIYTYEDLLKENLNWKFRKQIEFDLFNKEPDINKEKIQEFMKTLEYPLYFLDFETYQQPIPQFDGTKPYQQIPFQYSIHYIEEEGGELRHKEFLAEVGIDPRRPLAEKLVEDIPVNSCVLAYNMAFEKMVLRDLANLYPDLSEHLIKIRNNIKDLMIPFREKSYYLKEFEGAFSIKAVLPALFPNEPELDYHNLPVVHNGSEAMHIFPKLAKKSKEEQKEIREGLLKYCELDTYAMVKIWQKLKEV